MPAVQLGTPPSGPSYKEVKFTNVIGKLGRRWNNWESFAAHQVIWDDRGYLWAMNSSGGQQTSVPATSGSFQTTNTAFNLVKVSGSGSTNLPLHISNTESQHFSADGNPLVCLLYTSPSPRD